MRGPATRVPARSDGAEEVAVPKSVDLFDRTALERVVGPPRARDGTSAVHPDSEAAEVKRRVDGWLAQGRAERDAESGRIDPAWRELERDLGRAFQPPVATVKTSWTRSLRDQLLAFFREPERVRERPSERYDRRAEGHDDPLGSLPGRNARSLPFEQQQAALAALQRPVWVEIEVEARFDEQGRLVTVSVVRRSGRRAYDAYAVATVQAAAARDLGPRPGPATLRFRLRGAYVATIPTAGLSFTFDETGALHPHAKGASRFIEFDNPFGHLETEVAIISVTQPPLR